MAATMPVKDTATQPGGVLIVSPSKFEVIHLSND